MILTIAAKEFKSLFYSPLAWIILASLQITLAFLFLLSIDAFQAIQSQLLSLVNPPGVTIAIVAPLFVYASLSLLITIPLLGMHLIAEEKRNGTLPLLLAAPISARQIILGKFIGLMAVILIIVTLVALMAASLYVATPLDSGLLFSNIVGLILLSAAFSALSLYTSSLTIHPLVAAVSGIFILGGLWLLGALISEPHSPLLYLSPTKQFEPFNKGLIDTGAISQLLLFSFTFLALTIHRLEAQRLHS